MKRLFCLALVLLLAACGGGAAVPAEPTAASATAVPPTDTPQPTAAPTSAPTATATAAPATAPAFDLAAAIDAIPLPGHLSATISSDEELLKPWPGSGAVAVGDDFYNLVFHNDETGNPGGEVVVYVYDGAAAAAENFELIRTYFDTLIAPGDYDFVGDVGVSAASPPFEHRAFTLCTALVYVRMSGASFDQVDAYAQGVERAIKTAVCGPE